MSHATNKDLIGQIVYWVDPDEGICSGYHRIKSIDGEIFTISPLNNPESITEAVKGELRFYQLSEQAAIEKRERATQNAHR